MSFNPQFFRIVCLRERYLGCSFSNSEKMVYALCMICSSLLELSFGDLYYPTLEDFRPCLINFYQTLLNRTDIFFNNEGASSFYPQHFRNQERRRFSFSVFQASSDLAQGLSLFLFSHSLTIPFLVLQYRLPCLSCRS